MNKPTIFFNARAALELGLEELGLCPGETVAVPTYVCESILQPIRNLKLKCCFYQVDNAFHPNWEEIDSIVTQEDVKAILMIHYFGQPIAVEKFSEIAKKHSLALIEDNSHNLGGTFCGLKMGAIGDIGVSSPRKFLGMKCGGILYVGGNIWRGSPYLGSDTFVKNKMVGLSDITRLVVNLHPKLKLLISRGLNRLPNFNSPNAQIEPITRSGGAPLVSKLLINRILMPEKLNQIGVSRRRNWDAWVTVCKEHGGVPVFDEIHETSSPWALPIIFTSIERKQSFINLVFENNLIPFPWPILPNEILKNYPQTVDLWNKLVCVPLSHPPKNYALCSKTKYI